MRWLLDPLGLTQDACAEEPGLLPDTPLVEVSPRPSAEPEPRPSASVRRVVGVGVEP